MLAPSNVPGVEPDCCDSFCLREQSSRPELVESGLLTSIGFVANRLADHPATHPFCATRTPSTSAGSAPSFRAIALSRSIASCWHCANTVMVVWRRGRGGQCVSIPQHSSGGGEDGRGGGGVGTQEVLPAFEAGRDQQAPLSKARGRSSWREFGLYVVRVRRSEDDGA